MFDVKPSRNKAERDRDSRRAESVASIRVLCNIKCHIDNATFDLSS